MPLNFNLLSSRPSQPNSLSETVFALLIALSLLLVLQIGILSIVALLSQAFGLLFAELSESVLEAEAMDVLACVRLSGRCSSSSRLLSDLLSLSLSFEVTDKGERGSLDCLVSQLKFIPKHVLQVLIGVWVVKDTLDASFVPVQGLQ